MFRPLVSNNPWMSRSSSRRMACGFSGRIGTCPDYVAEVPDVLDRVDAEIRRREELVNFLEEQLQAWSNHPSASTWSVNQIDLD